MSQVLARLRAGSRFAASVLLPIALALVWAPAGARAEPGALIVRSDSGGLLGQRNAEIRQLRSTGQRVEIRGTCFSACTMYLGLENVCIVPTAEFGFHGPSWYGEALPKAQFDQWSDIMARNYREPLRSWFMTKARYETQGYYRMTGAQLIKMGYPRC